MAIEPINLFSHRVDPAGVARLIRNLAPKATIEGSDDDWSRIEVEIDGLTLLIRHDRDYYAGPDWPRQQSGMQGYFAGFEDAPSKLEALRMIRTFAFCVSIPTEDLGMGSSDPRLHLLYRIARLVDGVFFTPSALWDANGRVLFARGGRGADEDAEWPGFPSEGSIVGSQFDLKPPSADRVARRALALTAVVARASIEREAADGSIKDGQKTLDDLLLWSDLALDEFEPAEWRALQTPLGDLGPQTFVNSMWRVEGLAVLAWALGLYDLPRYDTLAHLNDVFGAMGLLDAERARALVTQARLRPSAELEDMQGHLLAFHWRLRDYSLRPQPMDFVSFATTSWFGGFDISRFDTIDNDLAITGTPITKADPDLLNRTSSTAQERHLAINWLLGESELYSETDVST